MRNSLLKRRPDLLAHALIALGLGLSTIVVLFATQLSALWTILFAIGLMGVAVFLGMPFKKEGLWAVYLLALPLGAAKWLGSEPYFFFGENPKAYVLFISDVPLFMMLGWWALDLLVGKGRVARSPIFLPLLLLLVWRMLSVVVAGDKALALWNCVFHLKFFLAFLWASSHLTDKRWMTITCAVLVFDLFVQGALNVASYFLHSAISVFGLIEYPTQRIAGQEIFRATGTIGPHNVQVHFYEMVMPIGAILFLRLKNPILRLFCLGAVLLSLAGTVFTFSRGGWASILLAGGLLALLLYARRLVSMTLLSSLALAGTLAVGLFLLGPDNVIGARLTDSPRTATTSRWHMLEVASRMIVANPLLGVGANNAAEEYWEYFPHGVPRECWYEVQVRPYQMERFIIPIHNKFMLIAAELGLIGLGLWIWVLVGMFITSYRCLRSSDDDLAFYGIWFISSTVGLCFHNMLSEFSYLNVLELFFVLLGIASGVYQIGIDHGTIIDPVAARAAEGRARVRARRARRAAEAPVPAGASS